MNAMQKKLLVGGIILSVTLCYLTYAGVKSGWVYYIEVDELLQDTKYQDQRIRVAGNVKATPFNVQTTQLWAQFELKGKATDLPVNYKGIIPENFKPDCQVVVEGKLDAQGVFQADVMLTKCASKYEAEDHAKRLEANQ